MHITDQYRINLIQMALCALLVKGGLLKQCESWGTLSHLPADRLCCLCNQLLQEIDNTGELLIIHPSESHVLKVAINTLLDVVPLTKRMLNEIDNINIYIASFELKQAKDRKANPEKYLPSNQVFARYEQYEFKQTQTNGLSI